MRPNQIKGHRQHKEEPDINIEEMREIRHLSSQSTLLSLIHQVGTAASAAMTSKPSSRMHKCRISRSSEDEC